MIRRLCYTAGMMASVGLIAASLLHRIPMDITEVLGFVTGGWAVWLTVKQNIWNWPIGIANDAFYVVVFLQARLFADMSLQVVYIVLGFLGWYWWLRGGENKTPLLVSRTSLRAGFVLAVIVVMSTAGLAAFLQRVHDSSPFLDAFTTVLSLAAQYMLTRKLFENWLVWITADVIYIGLYASRGLYLTAVLYFIFGLMCVVGLAQWRASMGADRRAPALDVVPDAATV